MQGKKKSCDLQVPLSGLKILTDCYTHKLPIKYLSHFHKKMRGGAISKDYRYTLPFIDISFLERNKFYKELQPKLLNIL